MEILTIALLASLGALVGGVASAFVKGYGEAAGRILAHRTDPKAAAEEAQQRKIGELRGLAQGLETILQDAAQKKVGELRAIADNLTTVQQEAERKKKGELDAIHGDLENVLRELRLVTKETETIKAQIGSELWDRQTRWNRRCDAYASLLGVTSKLEEVSSKITSELHRAGGFHPSLEFEFIEAASELSRVRAIASIFVSQEAIAAIKDFDSGHYKITPKEEIEKLGTALMKLEKGLVVAAQKDLGLVS